MVETSLTELTVLCRRLEGTASALTRDEASWLGLFGRCTSMAVVVITRLAGFGMPMSGMTTSYNGVLVVGLVLEELVK